MASHEDGPGWAGDHTLAEVVRPERESLRNHGTSNRASK